MWLQSSPHYFVCAALCWYPSHSNRDRVHFCARLSYFLILNRLNVNVCVCVSVREAKRESQKTIEFQNEFSSLNNNFIFVPDFLLQCN